VRQKKKEAGGKKKKLSLVKTDDRLGVNDYKRPVTRSQRVEGGGEAETGKIPNEGEKKKRGPVIDLDLCGLGGGKPAAKSPVTDQVKGNQGERC